MELLLNIQIDSNTQTNVADIAGNVSIESIQVGTNVANLAFHRQNDVDCLTLSGVFLVVDPASSLRIRVSPTFIPGTIQNLVSSCEITLTQQDLDSQNLESIIYNKVAAKLDLLHAWPVTVI